MDRENNSTLKLRQTLIKTMIVTAFTGNTVPVQSKVETLSSTTNGLGQKFFYNWRKITRNVSLS